jgi:hypothetical protein
MPSNNAGNSAADNDIAATTGISADKKKILSNHRHETYLARK